MQSELQKPREFKTWAKERAASREIIWVDKANI
jgi:hypothetical protein